MNNQYMLMFSLGPIQIFIEQARKARDLWIGSLLLSSLMEEAMKDIKGEFIFPAERRVRDAPDIPNKYVAIFASREHAQQAAEQSERQMRVYWKHFCVSVWRRTIELYGDQVTSTIWQRQTAFESLFDVYWVIVPRRGCDYTVWLDKTEQLFAARKRLRNFHQIGEPGNMGEPGQKSASSGEREILHTGHEDVNAFWKKVASWHSPKNINKEGTEHLDAIDTLKRFSMIVGVRLHGTASERAFPSTSSIATASFVEQLLLRASDLPALQIWREATKYPSLTSRSTHDIPSLVRPYQGTDREGILLRDGDLYFSSTFTPQRFKKDYDIADPEIARKGKSALVALLKATDTLNITRPTPYYGILQMDGDNMGVLLSRASSEGGHEDISKALSAFVYEDALPLVEEAYPARLVYAGGDDVLALAPLARDSHDTNRPHTIFELVYKLQSRYRKKIQNVPSLSQEKARVSASTGVVIAHHYTSLAYALRTARAAENAAKKRYGKNALVITLIRRSGEQTQVGCHWHYATIEAEEGQPIQLFSRFYTLFKMDMLSPTCVHLLLDEAAGLVGLREDAQASEIKRVLLRQLHQDQKSTEEKLTLAQEIKLLAARLARLAGAMDAVGREEYQAQTGEPLSLTTTLHSLQRRYGIVECFGWLLVMAFLARKDQDKE